MSCVPSFMHNTAVTNLHLPKKNNNVLKPTAYINIHKKDLKNCTQTFFYITINLFSQN